MGDVPYCTVMGHIKYVIPRYMRFAMQMVFIYIIFQIPFDSHLIDLLTWNGWEFGRQSSEALGAPLPPPFVSAGMIVFTEEALSLL